MVRQSGTEKRLKAQVKKDGMTYNYDLNHDGNYEAFPLQMGDGSYTVRIMENVSGSSYRELFSASFPVKLSSSLAPFLYPNQYVNYTDSSAAVKKSYDLCSGSKTDVDKLKAVYNFLIKNIKYDYGKAA
ncbi:MAG TPA: transglutaminase, partial [Ruminococcaceae bacterium]|nr:transglutaminase [Oscillospiraceae bacterium]